jgi:hypothetical protein
MLQMFDLNQEVSDKGEFGYFYESFIMQRLGRNKTPSIEMGTVVGYAARLAYRLFEHKSRFIGEADLAEFTHQYRKQFSMHFTRESMLGVLERAEVIRKDAEELYRFRYRFVYYYFVAKYFAMNLYRESERHKLRQQLNDMAARIYVDDFYFILLFIVYLTNDEKIVSRLLENGKSFYSEHDPCDLDDHVRHINNLTAALKPLSLDSSDIKRNRDAFEKDREAVDGLENQQQLDEVGDLKEQRQLDEMVKINVAFRTLQIMGSVLRNFPGGLEGEVKRELALGSYQLGLRILKFMLLVIEENTEYFREVVAGWVMELDGITDPRQVERRSNQTLFELQAGLGYAVIKKISQAVGSRYLRETYREVLTENNAISVRAVDTAIKLDHFISFPRTEVLSLHKDVAQRNLFVLAVLRTMVRDRFYLFTEERTLRQSICDVLGIQLNDPRIIEGKNKR